jgi:UDP-2-acetamido-3-amino-2,3-dideoxy-glucuronate N-acetyltransferase
MNNPVQTVDSVEPCGDCASAGVWCHETACVDQPSTIGPGTSIGPHVHIMAGASIGAKCQIGRNVVVASTAVIGDGVVIGHNVVVEDGVRLDAGVFCGPGVVFATLTKPRSDRLNEQLPSPAGTGAAELLPSPYGRGAGGEGSSDSRAKPIVVRQGATLGANATILGGLTVYDFAMVGAGAVVTHDAPRYAVMTGVPARQTGWLCRCTEHRLSFSGSLTVSCPACHRRYQMGHPGPKEFSPEEERTRHKAACFKFVAQGK